MVIADRALRVAQARVERVALIGNPNSGKTSVFNALTGSKYKVANYPGVTVEKREGTLELNQHRAAVLIDLPGTYTLCGESLDEKVTQKIIEEPLDLIVAVVDAGNLERNLYLISELIDRGVPVLVALNMVDLAEARGIKIREGLLARALGVPVYPIVASKHRGIEDLRGAIDRALSAPTYSSRRFEWAAGDQTLIATAQLPHHAQDISGYGAVATARYRWLSGVVRGCQVHEGTHRRTWTDRVDALVTHRVWGLVIFFAIMAILFQSIFTWASVPMEWIDSVITQSGDFISAHMHDGPLKSLVVDGILAGVGSVVIFVPQIALLFFFVGILEDSGYLCRAAFVMDRVMRKVGLQGRSFIPLLSSFACAIPGIMSARVIPSRADRFITILVAPLMSCSARLPVYTVLIAAFIPQKVLLALFSLQGVVLLGVYSLGVVGAAGVAWLLKRFMFRGEPALFVMEMPPFRRPSFRLVLREVYDRVVIFIKSAGTVILACSVLLWFLASHPQPDSSIPTPVAESYAGNMGKLIEPLIRPLGYDWQVGIALLTSFAAREVFVSTLATVYNLEDTEDSAQSLTSHLAHRAENGSGFGLPTALSLLVFYVFACQCMSTLAVCRREMGSWGWVVFMFGYMTALAYGAAFITYRLALYFL